MDKLVWDKDYIGKVVNADCLVAMKDIPDKSVDLVLTDPFYVPKINFSWENFDDFYWDFNKKWLLEVKRILKDDFHFIFYALTPSKSIIIFIKEGN